MSKDMKIKRHLGDLVPTHSWAEAAFGEPSDDFPLGWREHSGDFVRVWRDDWADDMFEVLPKRAIADLLLLGYTVRRPLRVCKDCYEEEV